MKKLKFFVVEGSLEAVNIFGKILFRAFEFRKQREETRRT